MSPRTRRGYGGTYATTVASLLILSVALSGRAASARPASAEAITKSFMVDCKPASDEIEQSHDSQPRVILVKNETLTQLTKPISVQFRF